MKLHLNVLLLSVACCAQVVTADDDRALLKSHGMAYRLQVLKEPRPNRVHIVRIDLKSAKARPAVVVGKDPDGDGPVDTELTDPRTLANDPAVLAYVNTNPWDSFPGKDGKKHRGWFKGQWVDIHGLAVADGKVRSPSPPSAASVWFDEAGKVYLGHGPDDKPVQGAAGFQPIVIDGVVAPPPGGARHPRTAIGIDRSGAVLWLVVVDGRQKGFSEGMDLHELGGVMKKLGCHKATNMDGGGSSVMGVVDSAGKLRIVNSPSDRVLGIMRVRPLPMILTIRKKQHVPTR